MSVIGFAVQLTLSVTIAADLLLFFAFVDKVLIKNIATIKANDKIEICFIVNGSFFEVTRIQCGVLWFYTFLVKAVVERLTRSQK